MFASGSIAVYIFWLENIAHGWIEHNPVRACYSSMIVIAYEKHTRQFVRLHAVVQWNAIV